MNQILEDVSVKEHIEVPKWIDEDITFCTVSSILQGGCDSGAYMPAVTYWEALKTMNEHGDEIFEYIDEAFGELTMPKNDSSWAGMACFFVSTAVELWAGSIDDQTSEVVAELEEEEQLKLEQQEEEENDERENSEEEVSKG